MKAPLVSVILTSYNQPELLERAFNSLIKQTYEHIEIIIVDDCSADKENKKLIEEFVAEFPEKVKAFYQQKNVGIPKNKNTGYRLASGEYITYLDGDDTYYENKIASEINTFLMKPDVDVVYSNFDIKELNGRLICSWANNCKLPEGYVFKDIITKNFPRNHFHRYEMFKRNVLIELNFYDEEYPVYHDLDFMLRYSLKYKVAYNNYIGTSYFKNPRSIVSTTKGQQLINEEIKVFSGFIVEIKKQKLYRQFKKYLHQQELNKLLYLDKPDIILTIKTLMKQPLDVIKIAKIFNYVQKKSKKSLAF